MDLNYIVEYDVIGKSKSSEGPGGTSPVLETVRRSFSASNDKMARITAAGFKEHVTNFYSTLYRDDFDYVEDPEIRRLERVVNDWEFFYFFLTKTFISK